MLSEHDVFPAALQNISYDERSGVMIGHKNNRFVFTVLAVF